MSSNEKLIIDRYGNGISEDKRASNSRAGNMEFHYTKKFIREFVTPQSSVVEIGCATGYYGLFLADKCKEYLGIDIAPANINIFKEKIKDYKLANVTASVGDAANLSSLKDHHFDVVMVLGPMYHLPPNERELVFQESKRICKSNGIIMFAYINKVGAYIKCCLTAGFENIYPNKEVNEFVLQKGIDDIHPELFFFTMPEEIEEAAAKHGLHILKNAGVDFTFNAKAINTMPDDQLEAWMELSDYMSNSKSCTGFSNHALLICRKP